MVKKIGSVGLLLGGLVAAIGAIGCFLSTVSFNILAIRNLAITARVGAIVLLVSALIVLVAVCTKAGSKKGVAIASLIFSIFAFIGQFLISPFISAEAAIGALGSLQASAAGVIIGLVLIAVFGVLSLIMGIVGLASKDKA